MNTAVVGATVFAWAVLVAAVNAALQRVLHLEGDTTQSHMLTAAVVGVGVVCGSILVQRLVKKSSAKK